MSNDLERMLRRHLNAVERATLDDGDRIGERVRAAVDRRRRRSRLAVGAATFAVLGVGVGGLALVRDRPDAETAGAPRVSSVPTPTPTVPATTSTAGPDRPDGDSRERSAGTVPAGAFAPMSPDPRGTAYDPAAVWTGTEVIVAGGTSPDGELVSGAAAYDPTTDTWRRLADPTTGYEPGGHGAYVGDETIQVWTGLEMLVLIGGAPETGRQKPWGLAYAPASDTWRPIDPPPTGFVRSDVAHAWTGSEWLMWPSDFTNDESSTTTIAPVAYDPVLDTWRELPMPPIDRRLHAVSVWSGDEWIVWGGRARGSDHADGAAYDPATDTWRRIADGPLSARWASGAWTGEELVIAPGASGGDTPFAHADGAAYDPATDSWRDIADGPSHPGNVAVAGVGQVLVVAKGGVSVYDVAADRWTGDCCTVGFATGPALWVGDRLVLAGGDGSAYAPPPPAELAACARLEQDVETEPPWRRFSSTTEWFLDGCLLRVDVIADRPGPDHCGWESTRSIVVGDPIGARYATAEDSIEYVRDPRRIVPGSPAGFADLDALPPDAVDTGYRSGSGEELWIAPDGTAIYVVDGETVERWPRADGIERCA